MPQKKRRAPQSVKERRAPQSARAMRRAKRRRKRMIRRVAWRSALSVMTFVVLVLVAMLCAGYQGFRGPSQTMGDLLTVSMLETSALKFVPRIYYSEAQVEEITARNSIADSEEETDTSLIVIAPPTPEPTATPDPDAIPVATPVPEPTAIPDPTLEPMSDKDGIQVYELRGNTYHGYMMVVQDPSRVTVGTSRDQFTKAAGLELYQIAERYDALAAINGGAFVDGGGLGNGSQPIGLVVSEGKLLHNAEPNASRNLVIGFTQDNILVFGKWTTQQAYDKKLRDAVVFGPALVQNGKAVDVRGISSGLNPRTAIGQRADGSVLLLVVDGRQANSLGATFSDLIKIMLDFDAINAANLDGGSSSLLYYEGDYVNSGVVLTGSRHLPTAFIVR